MIPPGTQEHYVIVGADRFRKIRSLLIDEDFDVRDTYAAQSQAFAKVWDDAELDIYDSYGKPAQ